MDCVNSFVFVLDPGFRMIMMNRYATAFFGYSAKELLLRPLSMLLAEGEWERIMELARGMRERRGGEAVFRTRSNTKALLRFSLTPYAGERLYGLLFVGRMVRAIDQPRPPDVSNGLVERMLKGFTDPLFIIDGASRVVRECNDSALAVFGFTRDELVGRRLLDHDHASSAGECERERNEAVMARADATYATAGIFQERILFPRKNLPPLPCDLTGVPILGPDGSLDSVIVMLFDRSTEEEHRSQLADLIGRVNALSTELVEATASYSTSTRAQSLSALGFTSRQIEIARLVAFGDASKEIGAKLGIAESTVKNHLTTIFHKLGVTSRMSFMRTLSEQHIRIN